MDRGVCLRTYVTAISTIASSLRSNYEQLNDEEQVVLGDMDGEEGYWEYQEDLVDRLTEVSVI
jgi:hypothetical protein